MSFPLPDPSITLVDPLAVTVGRVSDEREWIALDYEFEYDGHDDSIRILIPPDECVVMLVGMLLGLGFPESDTDYILDRYHREFR